MPNFQGWYCKENDGRWRRGDDEVGGLGKERSARDHGEQQLYRRLSAVAQDQYIYLFRQSAFPCKECQNFFLGKIAGNFIFVVHGNDGNYWKEWNFGNKPVVAAPPLPQVIYFAGGNVKLVGYVHWRERVGQGKNYTLRAVNENPVRPAEGSSKSRIGENAALLTRPKWFPEHPSLANVINQR